MEGIDNLTLKGINDPTVVGDGAGTGSQPNAAIHVDGNGPTQGTIIDGFTVRNPAGHYGIYAGTGGSNSDVDGFVLRNSTIEDIATNLSSHNALGGGVAGLYVRAQYNSLTVENNTVRNVDTTGDQFRNGAGLSLSSFPGDTAFDDSDTTSEAGNNTTVSDNHISDITGAQSSRSQGNLLQWGVRNSDDRREYCHRDLGTNVGQHRSWHYTGGESNRQRRQPR